VLALLWASNACAFIPQAAAILEQVRHKNPFKKINNTHFVAMFNKKATNLVLNKSGLHDNNNLINLYSLDILIKNTGDLKNYCIKNNINMNIVSLGFFGIEPVYIIGAQPTDSLSSQLWIDKSHWLIVKERGVHHEIIFDKWIALRSPEALFPRAITITNKTLSQSYFLAEK
jgi:hypothetical protein